MKVHVELRGTRDLSGLHNVLEQWETQFPLGKPIGMSCYSDFTLTLEMPPATQVIPPQLVDLSGQVEE